MMVLVLLLYLPGVGGHDAPSHVIRGGFDVYGDGDLCGPSWLAVSVGGGLSRRWALALISNAAAVLDGIGGGALTVCCSLFQVSTFSLFPHLIRQTASHGPLGEIAACQDAPGSASYCS